MTAISPKNEKYASQESDANIQKGFEQEKRFYNDVSSDSQFGLENFISVAKDFSNIASGLISLTSQSDERILESFSLTQNQLNLLRRRANEISSFGNVPYESAYDFLLILCYVDDYEILKRISEVINVPQLDREENVRNPDLILDIGSLTKVAFLASAVNAIIKRYSKFLESATNTSETQDQENEDLMEISSIISSITSIINTLTPEQQNNLGEIPIPETLGIGEGRGGEGNGPPNYPKYDNPPETGKEGIEKRIKLGNAKFSGLGGLAKLLTGKQIPAAIRANNPMEKIPSHVGKAFFGERAAPMAKTDLNEIFPKLIGVFLIPSNGVGSQGFDFQNFSNFTNLSVSDAIGLISGLSSNSQLPSIANKLTSAIDKFKTLTGATGNESLDLRRADNAIPFMIGMSSILTDFDKSPFSDLTFTKGWEKSLAVSNFLIKEDSEEIETLRALR